MDIDLTKPWAGYVPLCEVVRNPKQPRQHFAEDKLRLLGRSIRTKGQQLPCPVIPHRDPKNPAVRWMLVDGERRLRACGLAGVLHLWIAYRPNQVSLEAEGALHTASFTANFCREAMTKAETIEAVRTEMAAGHSVAEIAKAVGKTEAWVYQWLTLQRLAPELVPLLDEPTPKERRIGMQSALALAKMPAEKQVKAWEVAAMLKGPDQTKKLRQINTTPIRHGTAARASMLMGHMTRVETSLRLIAECTEEDRKALLEHLGPAVLLERWSAVQKQAGDAGEVMAKLTSARKEAA